MDKKQSEMKQQIASMMRKKDYYQILGLQKTAIEAQIKKSYKKLALRFHPDKNNTQGSKQVFKKVSNAYSVLINAQQRQRYDRFGPEQQQVRYRPQRHGYHSQDDEFDQFDDIFKAFFGMNGMQMRGNSGTFTFNMGGTQNEAQPRNQRFKLAYFFVFLFLYYTIAPLLKSPPYYSLKPNFEYKYQINSDILKTEYFARQGYFDEIKKNVNFKKQIDFEVDVTYVNDLKKKCDQMTRLQNQYLSQGYQYRPGQSRDYYLNQAKKLDLSSCNKIRQLNQIHQDYISTLNNYR